MLTLPLWFLLSCHAVHQAATEEAIAKANIRRAKTLIHHAEKALETYFTDTSYYPTEAEGGIYALIRAPKPNDQSRPTRWNGPYIVSKTLKDPWGNDLKYELVEDEQGRSSRLAVHIWSYGPNGKNDNGEGDDIKNW
jgi:type II secretion system protein G